MTVQKTSKFFPEEPETSSSSAAANYVQSQEPELVSVDVVAVPVQHEEQPISHESLKKNSTNITILGDYKSRKTSIAKRNTYITLLGNHKLDLRQVKFPSHDTNVSIKIIKLLGDIKLIVPPNVSVSVQAIMLCGNKQIEESITSDEKKETASNDVPCSHIKLTIVHLGGNVVVTTSEDSKSAINWFG